MLHNGKIQFLPAPFDVGQPYTGVKSAPSVLLTEDFLENLKNNFIDFESDTSLIEFKKRSPSYRTLNEFLNISHALFKRVSQSAKNNNFTFTLGGDHSIAFGSIAGQLEKNPNLCVLWFDAHGDLNTPDSSPSGNFHGMPLAALLNQKPELWLNQCPWFKNKLDPKRVILIGIRDLDPPESKLIEDLSLNIYTAEDIRTYGMPALWDKINHYLSTLGNPPLHLSFDIDGCDPRSAPATGTPVLNGVQPQDALYLVRKIVETQKLIGMDLVEVNPSLPIAQTDIHKTIHLAQLFILEALGLNQEFNQKNFLFSQLPTQASPAVNHDQILDFSPNE